MREIRTSGLMSGEGKRAAQAIPRPSSTLPFICGSRKLHLTASHRGAFDPMDDSLTPAPIGKGLAKTAGALAGIKVIDLTRVLGGPYCTMILSDHGADGIKIEPPTGDHGRDWGPPFHEGDASDF